MTTLQFKTKPRAACVASPGLDGWVVLDETRGIVLPKKWERKHVLKPTGRVNSFINSDMLDAVIKRQLPKWARLHDGGFDMLNPPEGVTIEDGFIKTVRIALPD